MLRFTTGLVTAMILLSGSVWAQICPTRIHPGHYYCNVHNEICTHGLSTPEIYYHRPRRPVVVQYGNNYVTKRQMKRIRKQQRRAQRRRARRNARICR